MTAPKDKDRDVPSNAISDADLEGVSGGTLSEADQARLDQLNEQFFQTVDQHAQQVRQIGDSLKSVINKRNNPFG